MYSNRVDGDVQQWRVAVVPLDQTDGKQLWLVDSHDRSSRANTLDFDAVARMAAMLGEFGIGICAVDTAQRVRVINDALASWIGTNAEIVAATHPPLRSFIDSQAAQHLQGGTSLSPTNVAFTAASGRTFDARVSAWQMPGGEDAMRLLIVHRTRRRADAGEHAAEAHVSAFEGAPIGAGLLDDEGRLLVVNQAWRDLTDIESAGGMLADYVVEADAPMVRDKLQEATRNGIAVPCDITLRRPEAEERVVTMFVAAVFDEDGHTPRFVAQFLDATERRELEKQFSQGQKMQAIGQLAGGIAHDFNNVLTAIIGNCDMLLLRHDHTDPSFSDVLQIKQVGNRAANMVKELLAFSRQQTLQPRVTSLTDVLADLSDMLRRLLGDKVSLRMVHGRDLGNVRVDQTQLQQVIMNLTVNARDAMPEGGTVSIHTSNTQLDVALHRDAETIPAGDYVRIEVTDTGAGIAPEILSRIYEPFFTTKPLGVGTGLGLSTVFGIVKQTGGFIWRPPTTGGFDEDFSVLSDFR